MPDTPSPTPRFLPWRFLLFLALCLSVLPLAAILPAHRAVMAGFDIAAAAFLLSTIPLLRHDEARMRAHARANDANRVVMLLITGVVMVVLLVVVAAELAQRQGAPSMASMALILGTLAIAWTFSNMVYALHYAFLYYRGDASGRDRGGIAFPGTGKPDYTDFCYFAFTLGMTFQTSDVEIEARPVRKAVTVHCLAAFVFNLGIIAFTINVLGAG
ncbi:DUF1345 domain-containing protein [Sphingobium sufflavum]|uniref:DUF1345 domain-containing protein n=1 Tax=Sphingobium sufflavum TaxID=1129547 RepID=UPI001F457400|nr:DUF1345 domain-containing protein [Sphingobium sufflavum]MCE7797655.1 DUF1345 domain-containing protein [Sphingobium sufflavum]